MSPSIGFDQLWYMFLHTNLVVTLNFTDLIAAPTPHKIAASLVPYEFHGEPQNIAHWMGRIRTALHSAFTDLSSGAIR